MRGCNVEGCTRDGLFVARVRINQGAQLGPHVFAGAPLEVTVRVCVDHRDVIAERTPRHSFQEVS